MQISNTPAHGFAAIHGAQMCYESAGNGAPILFLHAGVGDSGLWDHQFQSYATTHRVIRCDLRGFGQTRMVKGDFSFHEDVAALLEHLQIQSATVIGSSFGGAVAIDLALTHPHLVSTLVLVSPGVSGYRFRSKQIRDFFDAEGQAIEQGDLGAATDLNVQLWVIGPNRTVDAVNPAIVSAVSRMQLNVFSQPPVADANEVPLTPPAVDRLHTVDIPTLVIVGDHDVEEMRTLSDLVASTIPGARLEVMPGTAHLPYLEHPERFSRLVSDFIH